MVAIPRVSVVLPVFNGEMLLQEAIDSILNQTEENLELVIVDDGSADSSRDIISSNKDKRIEPILLESNSGLAAALNAGIAVARADLIARQDQDDVSNPQRLARQLAFMNESPQVGLVGTWAEIVVPDHLGGWRVIGHHRHPRQDASIRWRLLWNNPFVHSSVMFRRGVFEAAGRYGVDPVLNWPEDYDLWSRMAGVTGVANIGEVLVTYRQSPGGMSETSADRIRRGVLRIGSANLARVTGRGAEDPDVIDIVNCLNNYGAATISVSAALRRVLLLRSAAQNCRTETSRPRRADVIRALGTTMIRSVIRSG